MGARIIAKVSWFLCLTFIHWLVSSLFHLFINFFSSFSRLFSPILTASIRWDLIPQHLTWIPQVKSTLLSIGLSSGKVRERVRARSVRNVKEGALGWIPKSYPLCFSVDGGKKSRTTIGTEQTHRSWWAQWPRDGRQGSVSRGQGWRLLGGDRGGGVAGHGSAAAPSMSVVLAAILELWMCRGLQYCYGQWNMLKCTFFQRCPACIEHGHTHLRAGTHRGGDAWARYPKLCDDVVETARAGQPNHNSHTYLDDTVDICK